MDIFSRTSNQTLSRLGRGSSIKGADQRLVRKIVFTVYTVYCTPFNTVFTGNTIQTALHCLTLFALAYWSISFVFVVGYFFKPSIIRIHISSNQNNKQNLTLILFNVYVYISSLYCFTNALESVLVFASFFGKPNNICIWNWSFLGSRIIFVFGLFWETE